MVVSTSGHYGASEGSPGWIPVSVAFAGARTQVAQEVPDHAQENVPSKGAVRGLGQSCCSTNLGGKSEAKESQLSSLNVICICRLNTSLILYSRQLDPKSFRKAAGWQENWMRSKQLQTTFQIFVNATRVFMNKYESKFVTK
ncbi:hypothetical protein C0J52_08271 [Blattella germanica]|nr:hypothetical protein C0J52_08271 [Blattella germanica]